MLEHKVLVGARAVDDTQKIPVPGAFLSSRKKANKAIVLVSGFFSPYTMYIDYYATALAKHYPVYVTELRNMGLTKGKALVHAQQCVDAVVRDVIEINNIVYIGHSMGLPIALEATKENHAKAYIGLATYPSYGDCFTGHGDTRKKNIFQLLVDCIGEISNFGPLTYPVKDAYVTVPIHFIMAAQDEIVMTKYKCVRDLFKKHFSRFPKGSSSLLWGNHLFNKGFLNIFTPFNSSHPKALIDETMRFLENV